MICPPSIGGDASSPPDRPAHPSGSPPPTPSATGSPGRGASAAPRSQLLLDSRELAAITDALSLCREMISKPSLSGLQLDCLYRLELRLLFLLAILSPIPLPTSEALRLGWLQTRASDLFRDPRTNPRPFMGLLLPPTR